MNLIRSLPRLLTNTSKNNDDYGISDNLLGMFAIHGIFCKGLLGLFTLYSQNTLSYSIHIGMDSITSIPDLLINQIPKIQITMRYFFDRDGNYAGSSMQGWEILLLLLFPVALIIFLVFLPFYVFYKYNSREEDKKYEEEHPEILKVDSYITCWYPWHRYSVAYTLALIFWVIAFIIGILS